jgi:hypothetical protein
MFLMVRFAASVLALVTRVRMKVSIWGHQALIVLRSRVVSGVAAQVTYWLNLARSARAAASVVQASSRRSCSLTPQAALISWVGSSLSRMSASLSRPRAETVS